MLRVCHSGGAGDAITRLFVSVEFSDLPGCVSDGETIERAIVNGEDAKRCWISAMKEAGQSIPPPSVEPAEGCSGKWQLRAPKSLHRRLAGRAKREGVSLYTLAVTLLARAWRAVSTWRLNRGNPSRPKSQPACRKRSSPPTSTR